MEKLVVLTGPTAAGKTGLAIDLARTINGEIVSADSMQIYNGLDIGTAKATKEEQDAVVHHLIDILAPDEEYSVARFQKDAWKAISQINEANKMPLVVGGTGFYIKALFSAPFAPAVDKDMDFRNKMKELVRSKGSDFLHDRLAAVDPQSARRIHPNDLQRVIRALEIHFLSGFSATELAKQNEESAPKFLSCGFIVYWEREILYRRINQRVDDMFATGLLEEARYLYESTSGLKTALQALGYKELFPFFKGEIPLGEAKDKLKRNTRHYAKRQLTWFRTQLAQLDFTWLDMARGKEKIIEKILEILSRKNLL